MSFHNLIETCTEYKNIKYNLFLQVIAFLIPAFCTKPPLYINEEHSQKSFFVKCINISACPIN